MKKLYIVTFLFLGWSCGDSKEKAKSTNNQVSTNNKTSASNNKSSSNNVTTTTNNSTTNQNNTSTGTTNNKTIDCGLCDVALPECDGDIAIRYKSGCSNNECTSEKIETNCAIEKKICREGICVEEDLCVDVVCDNLKTHCEADVLISVKGKNQCNTKNGKCEGQVLKKTECAKQGKVCENAACVKPKKKRVFLSNARYNGDLKTEGGGASGLKGADLLCALEAKSENLGGKWIAWLSTSKSDAFDRLKDVGPWYLVDGSTLFVKNKASLVTAGPVHPLNMTPDQRTVRSSEVWTGTTSTGRKARKTCDGWEISSTAGGNYGQASSKSAWTEATFGFCSRRRRIYCFEQ